MSTVLVVDDEPRMLKIFSLQLTEEGYRVVTASDGTSALERLDQGGIDAVVTDMRMPGVSGHELLLRVKATSPHTPVIVITAHGTVENAVAAMRDGATDYILKPINMEELKLILSRSLELRRIVLENEMLRETIARSQGYEDLVGESEPMQAVFQTIELAAPTESTLLIRGASGTGKELVARAIHRRSQRAGGPYVPINCVAVPHDLLEDELFGHVRGAFTSAIAARTGKFEMANGGTLFLDEIGDMNPELQAKLLRAIQERVIEPIGAREARRVDVRIIAATNADLEEKVRQRTFREDLYYRLNVVPIHVPALKERKSDIPLLVRHFLQRKSRGAPPFDLSADTLSALMRYDWPGNVRELENVVERAVVLRSPAILESVLPPRAAARDEAALFAALYDLDYREAKRRLLDAFERAYFRRLLRDAEGVISRAAEKAGMHRKNLYQKIDELGVDPHEFVPEGPPPAEDGA